MLLAEHRISGLPVVDAEGHVVGVLSEGDILFKEVGAKDKPGLFERLARRAPERPRPEARRDDRRRGDVGAGADDRPEPAGDRGRDTMIDEGVNRLPVVDDDGG